MSTDYTEEQRAKAVEALFGERAVKAAVVPEVGWPSILKTDGKLYSEVFPEHFKKAVMEDFHMPLAELIPDWAEEYIPKSSDYLGDSTTVYNTALAYALKSVTHLVGYPGTGKSEGLPVYMAYKLGLPLIRLGLNKKGMGIDDLIGRESITNEDGVPVTKHKDGLLVKWVQIPSIILADEFARANVEITNGLMSLMERDGKLLIENRCEGQRVNRHPDCWIIASDNVKGTGDTGHGMVGTDQLDGAVLDRFAITIEVDYLDTKQSEKLLKTLIPGFPDDEAKQLCKFGKEVQETYKKGLLPISWSVRSMRTVAELACTLKSVQKAIELSFYSRFDDDDKVAVSALHKKIYGKDL